MWEDVKGGNDTGSTVLVCLGDSRLLVTCMSSGSPLLSLLGPSNALQESSVQILLPDPQPVLMRLMRADPTGSLLSVSRSCVFFPARQC